MKKDKRSSTQKSAANKRGEKRSLRMKKTQAQKHVKKLADMQTKKLAEKKREEEIMKILQSRNA